ncbi:MAG: DUF5941 domain-containing protein [Streptosporangiaceae bacterium]
MTVALVLSGDADAGLCGQLKSLGVRRVDAAERTGPGLLTVAAAARAVGEQVLLCVGDDACPEPVLARLLAAGGTAAFTGAGQPARWSADEDAEPVPPEGGALIVDRPDLDALAIAAEALAAADAGPVGVDTLVAELTRRGVTVRVLDAGPDSEGAVTQLLADPAAQDVARWAGQRRLTPASLYGISLGLGLIAAIWFSELAVRATLLAVVALTGSFLAGRAGSLLAATSPASKWPLISWLGAATGLLTELGLYAALAVSAEIPPTLAHVIIVPATGAPGSVAHRIVVPGTGGTSVPGLDGSFGGALQHTFIATIGGTGTAGVWRLAVAAAILLGLRKMAELGYEQAARGPGNLFPRSVMRTVEQAAILPAGERLVLIVFTAVFFGPRLTFVALLAWGALATGWLLGGQIARSLSGQEPDDADGQLVAYRGDGILARWFGLLAQGRLIPLPPLLVGLFVTCVLAGLGLGNLSGILILTPVEAMFLAALGAWHPHDGRLDWLVPALLTAGECVFLAALGLSRHVTGALVFALLAAVLLRHIDLAYRARAGYGLAADRFGLGWEGRMLVAGIAAIAGILPLAFALLSGYLWLLFCWEFLSGWLRVPGTTIEEAPVDRDGPRRRRRPAAPA